RAPARLAGRERDPDRAGGSASDLRAVLRASPGCRAACADPVLPAAVPRLLLPLPCRPFVLVRLLLGRDDGIRDRLEHASSACASSPPRRPSIPSPLLLRSVLR